jgi:hypothetical protein
MDKFDMRKRKMFKTHLIRVRERERERKRNLKGDGCPSVRRKPAKPQDLLEKWH